MSRPPDFQHRLLPTTDIPIHRDSVGAMGISQPPANEHRFKPYVYGASPLALRPSEPVDDLLKEFDV